MRQIMLSCLATVGLGVGIAQADVVSIQGVVSESGEQTGATYLGSLEYNFISGNTGELKVSLTNTSPASVGGFLTGFLFRLDGISGVTLTSAIPTFFQDTGADSGSPFGQFDGGAALGGDFQGGGPPSDGLGIGASGFFVFSLTSASASTINATDFLGTLDTRESVGFLVRFQSLSVSAGSDKVPGGTDSVVIPLPNAGMLAGAGLMALGLRRRR